MYKKKALIITLYGNYNFGNKLQNYALKQTLEKLGLNVKTAVVKYEYSDKIMAIKSTIKKWLNRICMKKEERLKEKKFLSFNKKYLECSKTIFSTKRKRKIEGYDFLIYGSDQIWNPSCFGDSNLYLGFCGSNKINISYAASFGVSSLPVDLIERYFVGFDNFANISVREEQGIEILKEIGVEKDINVVLDPTLLLCKEEWEQIVRMPDWYVNQGYILMCFLSDISKEDKEKIVDFAKNRGLHIINIMDSKLKQYIIGPEEFLFLIKNATLVCTDSYHASVFSFIFSAPLYIYERRKVENMNSRIDTLVNSFKLENNIYKGVLLKEDLYVDYQVGHEILEGKRKESLNFLKKSLCVKQD